MTANMTIQGRNLRASRSPGTHGIVALLLVLSAVGAACSSPKKQGAIEVIAVWKGTEQDKFKKVLAQFTKQYGIAVNYTQVDSDKFRNSLLDRVETGQAPDIAILPQAGLLNDLVIRKALVPVDSTTSQLVDRNYQEVWRSLGSVRGTLYGVWFKAAHKSLIWYRTAAFENARIPTPRNWPELLTTSQALAKSGTPFALGAADGWTLTDWFENIYLRTAGPRSYDDLACHRIKWTDQTVRTAFSKMADIFGHPEWIAGGITGSLATPFDRSIGQVYNDPASAAMVGGGDFVTSNIPTGKKLGVDANYFDFPAIDNLKPALVVGGDVAVRFSTNTGSQDFMRFIASKTAAEPWVKAGGFISPNKNLDQALYPDSVSLALAKSVTGSDDVAYDLSDRLPAALGASGNQGMWKILQDYLRNPAAVDNTMDRLEEGASVADVRCR